MSPEPKQRPLPGVAAVGLYMFLLCILGVLGVTEHKLPKFVYLFCIAFALAGQGLLRQKRWGWALVAGDGAAVRRSTRCGGSWSSTSCRCWGWPP